MNEKKGQGIWRSLDPSRAIVRYRLPIVLIWLVACVVLIPLASGIEKRLEGSSRISGSESAAVEDILQTRFTSPFGNIALLIIKGLPPLSKTEGRARLQEIVAALRAIPEVTGTLSYLDMPDPLFTGDGGTGSLVIVGLQTAGHAQDEQVLSLRSTTKSLSDRFRHDYPDVQMLWTGDAPLNFDMRKVSAEDVHAAEVRALPGTLLLLIFAFGAIFAAFFPVIMAVLAISLTLGIAALLSKFLTLSILLQSVTSILGLALGIDYSLLMVSRFREGITAGLSPVEAAVNTVRYSGYTVMLSGASCVVGFATLLIVPVNELQSVAMGGLIVVGLSVLLATTLLPGLLAFIGSYIDLGRVRRQRRKHSDRPALRRWGRWITTKPWRVLLVATIPIILLAFQALRLHTGTIRSELLPAAMESARAMQELETMQRSSIVQMVHIIIELPPGTSAFEREGWEAVRRLGLHFSHDPRVGRVLSLPTIVRDRLRTIPIESLVAFLPDMIRLSFASRDGRIALIELLPKEELNPREWEEMVRELRTTDIAALTGIENLDFSVGGLPALSVDYLDTVNRWFFTVIGLVLGGTFAALFFGYRSLLVPIKAVVLNILSVAAALGAAVLIFQDGYGVRLIGLAAPVDAMFPTVPILVFCVVFGISMDYEVFLVSRVAEARKAGLDEVGAITEGLERTGGLITSAAAIMILVFASFTFGQFLPIKMLGFTLAFAVFIDATIIRLAIGPALLKLAGRWNWWPGERAKRS